MFFDRIRRAAALTSLGAAMALAAPAGSASAAVDARPTAITITPEFADTIRAGIERRALSTEGAVEVAQATPAQIRRRRMARRRQNARVRRADRRRFGRERRADRRQFARERRADRRRFARQRRADRRRYYGDRLYRNGRWYYYNGGGYYDNDGIALALGVIGLAAGAVAGAALAAPRETIVVEDYGIPAPYTAEWYRRCDLKYRSFRASDGTYLGYDGVRHTCRLP